MSHPSLQKIVSGGQTGVDRAALDVAIFLEIEHGGWCPLGRRAEDGRIPGIYCLKQSNSRVYSQRTEKNVIDSDGTLILYRGQTTGGTELTRKLALRHNRPLLCIDLDLAGSAQHQEIEAWIRDHNLRVLNIAGPRESSCPGIARQSESFLVAAFQIVNGN